MLMMLSCTYCSRPTYDSASIELRLQCVLTDISEWCKKNCIYLNLSKTKYCLYGIRNKLDKSNRLNLLINGCHVVRCNKYNYFGITLDDCLTLKPHCNTSFKIFTYKVFQFGKLTLCQRRKLHLLTLMFQLYGSNDFWAVSTRDTRLGRKYMFELTRARVDLYNRFPYVVGARIWNLLPLDVQSCSSLTVFKARVSDYLKELVV